MAADNVRKLRLVEVGSDFRFDADELLENAKGHGFTNLVIIGEQEDGEHWIGGTANAGEALVLMERAKRRIVFGDDE